jgi:5-(aminomethyl)-3-furanmethanol phosphate kinase
MRGLAPAVVKLGGSFAFSEQLRNWIEALAACGGQVVIVPGGGPFADAVRLAQTRMGFDDRAAHQMALLAMEQYGRALASFNSALSPADSVSAIRRHLDADRVPVWMPSPMVLRADDISPSWDVTSDSLAAWLAARIGADRVFLVKRAKNMPARAALKDLIAAGIVDEAFAPFLKGSAAAAFILGPSDHETAASAIRSGATAGVPVG